MAEFQNINVPGPIENAAVQDSLRRVQKTRFIRAIVHGILRLVPGVSSRSSQTVRIQPSRILLMNGSHIGDMVISTSIFPVLRKAFPEAQLGFVTGSWSSMVVEGHPDIAWVHRVDHWKKNRGKASRYRKFLQFFATRRTALKEIKALRYDLALSFYPWHPDFLDLAWLAKIPVRVGFKTSMFAPLATVLADLPENLFIHQGARQAAILRPLSIDESCYAEAKTSMPPSSDAAIEEVRALLQASNLEHTPYCIIHMGSGELSREMPPEFWHQVAAEVSKKYLVLFTGRGSREKENSAQAIGGLANCMNACDRLSWQGFVTAVRHAKVLFGVESMAGHVASAVGTKSIMAYAGGSGVARWKPESNSTVFTNHLECAPCLNAAGCESMACLRKIQAQDLVAFFNSSFPS